MRIVVLDALVMLTASCETEPASAPSAAHPCLIAKGASEEKLLQRTLRSEQFQEQWFSTTEKLVQRLEKDIRQMKPGTSTVGRHLRHYIPEPPPGSDRLTIELSWTSPDASGRGIPSEHYAHYNINGVPVEATDIIVKSRVACRLPGDLEGPTEYALLRAVLASTLNIGRRGAEAQKQQGAFLYVMARRATDALGCQNKPLHGVPEVKPGKG